MNALVDIRPATKAKPKPQPPSDLFVCTRLVRTDADGDRIECDVVIYFEIESYIAGYPDTREDPGCGPEYEFSFLSSEFDGGEPDDAPGPLTETEIATLQAWFEANHDKACEVAADRTPDRDADRADYLYDQWRDERMERGL